MLQHTSLLCTLLRYAAPNWAMLHLTKQSCDLWATVCCTLLSYIGTYWAMLHPTELCCALLSYTAPCGATLHPLSYSAPNWTTYPCYNFKSQNVELSAFGQSSNRMKNKCRWQNQFGTGIRGLTPVPKSIGAGLRWRMPECRCRRSWPRSIQMPDGIYPNLFLKIFCWVHSISKTPSYLFEDK